MYKYFSYNITTRKIAGKHLVSPKTKNQTKTRMSFKGKKNKTLTYEKQKCHFKV